jgi:twitching motility protein PilT
MFADALEGAMRAAPRHHRQAKPDSRRPGLLPHRLLCQKKAGGRCAVHEILLSHDARRRTIRAGNISANGNIIEGSMAEVMISMAVSLRRRFDAGEISAREAYMKATDKATFETLLAAEGGLAGPAH